MVLFNYSTKEITAKIVYYGPGLCGKTTNLQFIYDNLPGTINKGKMLSLATKTDRTLFFDFLPIDLGTIRGMRTRLQLYTVPGQVFYNTTRKLVLKGADGIVFVADSQKQMIDPNIESLRNLEENLAEHDIRLSETPLIIQFNKRDLPDVASVEDLNTAINRFNSPIYEAVATTGIGVHETLKAITRLVLNSLRERYADKREQRAESPERVAAIMAAAAVKTAAAAAKPAPAAASQTELQTISVHAPSPTTIAPEQPMFSAPLAASAERASLAPAAEVQAPMDLGPPISAEDPTLDFALPEIDEHQESEPIEDLAQLETEASAIEGIPPAPPSEPLAAEPIAGSEEPLDVILEAEPDSVLELMPEAEPLSEAGAEDVLELMDDDPLDTMPPAEDSLEGAHLEPLEVMEEVFPTEETLPEEASQEEPEPIPITMGEAPPEEYELFASGAYEAIEPLEEAAGIESASWGSGEALVSEDRHDDALLLGGLDQAAPAIVLPVEEGPLLVTDLESGMSGFETPIVPFVPTAPVNEGQSEVRAVSVNSQPVRDIHLPIRLEIGGQAISFDLRISLNLAAVPAGPRKSEAEEGGTL